MRVDEIARALRMAADDRELIGLHESGHCLAALACNTKVEAVEVQTTNGTTWHHPTSDA